MIFMSQSGLAAAEREPEWDRWYADHLAIMLTVDGIDSAQRFKTASAGHPPSLAIYTIASEAVFRDVHYQKIRGMGAWAPLIVKAHYRRNLFDGRADAPAVADDQVLLVFDRPAPDARVTGIGIDWLTAAGLDRSTPFRGIAVVPRTSVERLGALDGAAVYAPATAYLRGNER